jgi:hypothetical protein
MGGFDDGVRPARAASHHSRMHLIWSSRPGPRRPRAPRRVACDLATNLPVFLHASNSRGRRFRRNDNGPPHMNAAVRWL